MFFSKSQSKNEIFYRILRSLAVYCYVCVRDRAEKMPRPSIGQFHSGTKLKGACPMIVHILALAAAAAIGIYRIRSSDAPEAGKPLCFLVYFVPFLSGGFYPLACAAAAGYLLVYLAVTARRQKGLRLSIHDSLPIIGLLTAAYCVSFLWSVDKGMAVWGGVRFLPVLLFCLALHQLQPDQSRQCLRFVPLSGVVMTVFSGLLQHVPALAARYTVDARLAGFFEYPNTYAAFLLAGLVISTAAKDRSKWSLIGDFLLIYGIFDSGSRTAFVLLLLVLVMLCLTNRSRRFIAGTVGITAACIAVVLVLLFTGADSSVGRFLAISLESSTLLGRLLYFKDALGVIAGNPFGLGYMGYRCAQGSFQTGVYDVTYVHNWLLQLLLDVGWVPALGLCWLVLSSFFSRKTESWIRMVMLVVIGHSMMDFDMEFLAMWLVLLPCLQLTSDKQLRLTRGGVPALAAGAMAVCVCLWLGAGDLLFRTGNTALCLQVTPFHTQAMEYQLTQISDPEELDQMADRLLALNPRSSLGHSAKANAAYAAGDVVTMVEQKQLAIANARYDLEEYCDYFNKLYHFLSWYYAHGDTQSGEICRDLLMKIPAQLRQLNSVTSELAWKLDAVPQLELPEEYQQILAELAS